MPSRKVIDKVAYVKRQGQTRPHHCHGQMPGCLGQCPPAAWGCKNCWFKLPKRLRDKVWASFRPGQEVNLTPSREYLGVAQEVQDWIRENYHAEPQSSPIAQDEQEPAVRSVQRDGQGVKGGSMRPVPGNRQAVPTVQQTSMIAIDCETTGFDFWHGARPYFVTTCNEQGEQTWYEWDVDPLTREVRVVQEDITAIRNLLQIAAGWGRGFNEEIQDRHKIVGHNLKFDAHALYAIGAGECPWSMVHDTIVAAHLLASNQPKNLTDLAMHWLGKDIQPLEDRLEKVVQYCRRSVQQARLARKREAKKQAKAPSLFNLIGGGSTLADWAIAEEGRSDMPSVKEKSWKQDAWLPRAMVLNCCLPETVDQEEALAVLPEYSNADSATTIQLWFAMEAEIKRRGLWELYLERIKLLPIFWGMEQRGVTYSKLGWQRLRDEYGKESLAAADKCRSIAHGFNGYDLEVPAGGNNKSLTEFCFDVLKLPIVGRTEKGNPSLDKDAITEYLVTLPQDSEQLEFMENLVKCRSNGTIISYLDGYKRYALPTSDSKWLLLHPNINTTGTQATRQSSSNPNSQNVKKGEDGPRACFGPAPGREWWSLDGENLELRLPAYESGEQSLIELFERSDEPPFYGSVHMLNFSVIYDDVWKEGVKTVGLDKVADWIKEKRLALYKMVKNGDFAIQYGAVLKANGWGTADRALGRKFSHAKLEHGFKALKALKDKVLKFAQKHGYVEIMPDKTVNPKKGYPLLCTRTERGNILETVPFSYHVQGSAGWWMMKAMIRCQAQLDEWNKGGFDGRITLQVHDELVFDFPKCGNPIKDNSRAVLSTRSSTSNLLRARQLQALMQRSGDDLGVPTPVSIAYHPKSWGEEIKL